MQSPSHEVTPSQASAFITQSTRLHKTGLTQHEDWGLPCPQRADINYIKIMTDAIHKCESVPECKEMIFNGMFHNIARIYSRTSLDSFIKAIIDWIILGSYIGFQKSKWCSNHHDAFITIDDPNWGDRPTLLSIIADNFSFTMESGQCPSCLLTINDDDIVFTSCCI
jgi:hypothetical protein